MSESKAQQDPSMEEILASIRRIISEGDEPSAADRDEPRAVDEEEAQADEPAEVAEEVLELTEVVSDEDSEEEQPEPTDFEVDLVEDEADDSEADDEFAAEPEHDLNSERPSAERRELATTDEDDDRLVSDDTAAASSDAFAELAQSVAAAEIRQDSSPRISHGGSDRTLEDVVREAIRPLLKDWLDKNLPSLVHHLVKKEIERLSRR